MYIKIKYKILKKINGEKIYMYLIVGDSPVYLKKSSVKINIDKQ